jgi:membrane protein
MEIRVGDHGNEVGNERGRGRHARSPSEIPKRGWKDILLRTKQQIGKDNLSIVASGVAFWVFLSLFPGIAAAISILGLVMDPTDVERFVGSAGSVLPPDALRIVEQQVHAVASSPKQTLGISLLVSVGVALWTATAGVKALMNALNIAYEEKERRGFFRYYGMAILLTVGSAFFLLFALALVAALPAALELLPIPSIVAKVLGFGGWVILAAAMMLLLSVMYRFGPSRSKPQWQWVSWGAGVATFLWLVGSALFSLYVTKFGDYNKTYGALAAIVILLTWLYLTAFVILLGAELNAEMEHQTRIDSTTGRPKPMGRRNARMADSLGESK